MRHKVKVVDAAGNEVVRRDVKDFDGLMRALTDASVKSGRPIAALHVENVVK